ncbi:26S proteasome non-ATPase regulatory subunit, partial [Massospora cicadina]
AAGFLQAVHKLALIVQLLMEDLPDRKTFWLPMLRLALVPYLHITQAVHVGDLAKIQTTLAQYRTQFQEYKNYNQILHLRHNAIKT